MNPRIIYAQGPRPGRARPRRATAAATTACRSGRAAAIADRLSTPGQPPFSSVPPSATSSAACAIAGGVAAALFQRERTGRASRSTSRCSAPPMWVLSPDIVAAHLYGTMLPSAGEMPPASRTRSSATTSAPTARALGPDDAAGRALLAALRRDRRPAGPARAPSDGRGAPGGARRASPRSSPPSSQSRAARRTGRRSLRASECIWAPLQIAARPPRRPAGAGERLPPRAPRARRHGQARARTRCSSRRAAGADARPRRTPARTPRRSCWSSAARGTTSRAGRTRAWCPDAETRLHPGRRRGARRASGRRAQVSRRARHQARRLRRELDRRDQRLRLRVGRRAAARGGVGQLPFACRGSSPRACGTTRSSAISLFSMDRLAGAIEEYIDFPKIYESRLELEFIVLNLSRGRGEMYCASTTAPIWRELRTLSRAGYAIPVPLPADPVPRRLVRRRRLRVEHPAGARAPAWARPRSTCWRRSRASSRTRAASARISDFVQRFDRRHVADDRQHGLPLRAHGGRQASTASP